jgi:DNA-binding transcriptional ArsR family regulator
MLGIWNEPKIRLDNTPVSNKIHEQLFIHKGDGLSEDICQSVYIDADRISRIKSKLGSSEALFDLAEIFKMLGDPTRVRILHALSLDELCVCEITALLGMTQSAVSHQLRLLRAGKLVKYRKEGKMVYYSLDDDHVRKLLSEGLDHIAHKGLGRVH